MSYRTKMFKKDDATVIMQKDCPTDHPMWLSDTIYTETWQDSEGWHTRLFHVDGSKLGVLSSKDGTALLTIDVEGK